MEQCVYARGSKDITAKRRVDEDLKAAKRVVEGEVNGLDIVRVLAKAGHEDVAKSILEMLKQRVSGDCLQTAAILDRDFQCYTVQLMIEIVIKDPARATMLRVKRGRRSRQFPRRSTPKHFKGGTEDGVWMKSWLLRLPAGLSKRWQAKSPLLLPPARQTPVRQLLRPPLPAERWFCHREEVRRGAGQELTRTRLSSALHPLLGRLKRRQLSGFRIPRCFVRLPPPVLEEEGLNTPLIDQGGGICPTFPSSPAGLLPTAVPGSGLGFSPREPRSFTRKTYSRFQTWSFSPRRR